MTAPDAAAPTGAIYDIGYQHYHGKRLGRAGAVRALYIEGIRGVFGIGRGGRAKIPPVALVAMLIIPAVIQSAVTGLAGGMLQLFTHASYFRTTVWLFGLFCAFQTPELVTGDQQYRVLALYFSRALLRRDYVLARVGALATSLFAVAILPHLILLIGSYFAADNPWTVIKASAPTVPRIIAAALAIAVLFSTISLMVAAVIRRRPLATAAILAIFLLASGFVGPLVFTQPQKMRYLVLASPALVGEGVTTWIFDTTSAKPASDTTVATPPPDSVTAAVNPRVAAARRRALRRQRTILQLAELPGPTFLLALAGYILAAAGVLTLRYRKLET